MLFKNYFMKRQINQIYLILSGVFFTMVFSACDKKLDDLTPHNVNFEGQQFATKGGYLKATVGNYAGFTALAAGLDFSKTQDLLWLNISEFRGNNVTFIDAMPDRDRDAFDFDNSSLKDLGYSHYYWVAAHKTLLGINMVLKNIRDNETDVDILNAKGENLFMRAVLFFDMVRIYGRPYYQSPESNLGIPLITRVIEDIDDKPARATVKENYDQIIKDLKE